MASIAHESPLLQLSPEDLAMVCTFVLASGSVKDLAESYGVSYPTMRSRLDALIARLKHAVDDRQPDPLSDYLADLITKGRISPADAAKLRDLHRNQVAQHSALLEEQRRHEPTSNHV